MTPLDRSRLAALLGMLGSSHDGEVVNAARAAERMRKTAGLTWHQVLVPLPVVQPTRATDIEDDLDLILDSIDELSGWEARFARSVAAQSKWSEKQIEIIRRTAAKLRRMAKAAA
jgi:hypothetical protein